MNILNKILNKIFGKNSKVTVSDTLPFKTISRDGITLLENNYYSKTFSFEDINYKLISEDNKKRILNNYCEFLNSLSEDIKIQLTFINKTESSKKITEFSENLERIEKEDKFNDIRKEYSNHIKEQFDRSNNGIKKERYITVSLQEKNLNLARKKLNQTEILLDKNFSKMGSKINPLSVDRKMNLLNDILNSRTDKEEVNIKKVIKSGESIKDMISPDFIAFDRINTMRINKLIGKSVYVKVNATELEDTVLQDLLAVEGNIVTTLFIEPVNFEKSTKIAGNALANINKTILDEKKKSMSAGFDPDIIPPDLELYQEESKNLLRELKTKNQKYFFLTFCFFVYENKQDKIDDILFKISSVANQHQLVIQNLSERQEQGFITSLPLGLNEVGAKRGLTTSALSIFSPFSAKELIVDSPGSLYYGNNKISGNIIYFDRKSLKNPAGLFLGTPGAGKSFTAKRECTDVFLSTEDDIIITDPEREYVELVNELGGQVVEISSNSTNAINPFDIDYSLDEAIKEKSIFVLSFIEQLIAGKEGLTGSEVTTIDKATINMYNKAFLDNQRIPIFSDLSTELSLINTETSLSIKERLDIYVTGSLNIFNNLTNVDLANRIICFDIHKLSGVLKTIGMLTIQELVWSKISKNRSRKKYTWYYIDEIHLMLNDERTAHYLLENYKRFRKYLGIITGMTQNVSDVLTSKVSDLIFKNSEFIILLNQSPLDRELLQTILNLSDEQIAYISDVDPGEGLLVVENSVIAFKDRFPKYTKLYSLMTTKLEKD
ncbi:VirB4-like conjugal transfer ATPase, CD1110 family [Peptoniphilaceae bacterium SGI.131]